MDDFKKEEFQLYFSNLDTFSANELRERVQWVCENSLGKKILVVGSNDGLIPIVLGREEKNVLCIEINETKVELAQKNLSESDYPLKNVSIKNQMFTKLEDNQKYDVIIFDGILSKIYDLQNYMQKAHSLLSDSSSRIIIINPLGKNEKNNHEKTVYFSEFLKLQNEFLKIYDMKFFNGWSGVIFKREPSEYTFSSELLHKLVEFEEIISGIESENDRIKTENEELKYNLDSEKIESDYKDKYLKEKAEKVQIQKELVDDYDKRIAILDDYRSLLQRYKSLLKSYNNLKSSKLGKLTSKYWEFRKGLRRK